MKRIFAIAWLSICMVAVLSLIVYGAICGDEGAQTALGIFALALFCCITIWSVYEVTTR